MLLVGHPGRKHQPLWIDATLCGLTPQPSLHVRILAEEPAGNEAARMTGGRVRMTASRELATICVTVVEGAAPKELNTGLEDTPRTECLRCLSPAATASPGKSLGTYGSR